MEWVNSAGASGGQLRRHGTFLESPWFPSSKNRLANCIVLRHFPANLGCTKGIGRRTRREEGGGRSGMEARGAQGAVGDVSALRHGLLME